MPNQDQAFAVSVSGSAAAGWVVKIYYNDGNGDPHHATSTDDAVVEQVKWIRDQWEAGRSVKFEFIVSGPTLDDVITTTQKP